MRERGNETFIPKKNHLIVDLTCKLPSTDPYHVFRVSTSEVLQMTLDIT